MVVLSPKERSRPVLSKVVQLSVLGLAIYGFSRIFEDRGLPELGARETTRESQPVAVTVDGVFTRQKARSGASAETRACEGIVVTKDAWAVAPEGSLPNPRAVLRGTIEVSGGQGKQEFKVYHATGRPMVVARQTLLADEKTSACISEVAEKSLTDEVLLRSLQTASTPGWTAAKVDARLVSPEPSWVESNVASELQLPWAREFVGTDPMGKLYLDTDAKRGGFEGKKPRMIEVEYNGWAKVAEVFNNGGRHLDFGTGTSSHYACGVYAYVNAIDSQQQYCDLVQSQLTEAQSRCGKINMNCVDVGQLAEWGKPVEGVTDVSFYFSQYVNAVEGFNNSPYYDSALVDGRFRVACAIKTLKYLRRDSVFFIHDWPRSYQDIKQYADHLGSFGSLALLAPKANLTAGSDMEYQNFSSIH